MFLDDEIVWLVSDRYEDLHTFEDAVGLVKGVVDLCLKDILKNFEKMEKNGNSFKIAAKKACNAWDLAAKRLEKEGRPYLKVGAFREYLLHKEGVADILKPLGF